MPLAKAEFSPAAPFKASRQASSVSPEASSSSMPSSTRFLLPAAFGTCGAAEDERRRQLCRRRPSRSVDPSDKALVPSWIVILPV
ncbi:hypothetical protein PC119_g24437 [Phytophthora cactorum]|nr:hypothetical protein PC119_g24437 [Phytophthora cactorum]